MSKTPHWTLVILWILPRCRIFLRPSARLMTSVLKGICFNRLLVRSLRKDLRVMELLFSFFENTFSFSEAKLAGTGLRTHSVVHFSFSQCDAKQCWITLLGFPSLVSLVSLVSPPDLDFNLSLSPLCAAECGLDSSVLLLFWGFNCLETWWCGLKQVIQLTDTDMRISDLHPRFIRLSLNIARGTKDPGYCFYNLNYLSSYKTCKFSRKENSNERLLCFHFWPPRGPTCIR